MSAVGNLLGVVLSGAYVFAVLAASSLLARRGASAEATRKLVHIGLGGWWVVASWFFTSAWWAAALPALFVAVNYYAYRKQRLSFMAREEGEDTPGTVYYAVSLVVLALYAFGIGAPYVGALGVLCMAFGDGLAAVAGKRFGRRRIAFAGGGKSYAGSAAMLGASFLSCLAVLLLPAPVGAGLAAAGAQAALAAVGVAFVLAVAATLFELFSVDGLDNLFVPLGVVALYVALFLPGAPFAPLLAGVALSGAVAVVSLRMRLLTRPGALGAVVVGALSFGIGGWPLWLLLMWFFGSSNIASKLMARRAAKRGHGLGAAVAAHLGLRRARGQHRRHVGVRGGRVQQAASGEHPHAQAHAARALGRREPAWAGGHRHRRHHLGVSGHARVPCVRLRHPHRARRVLLHHRLRRGRIAR